MTNADNLTEYRVVVTGERCGGTRTYLARSAWIDCVVAAAVAAQLKPRTQDTQPAIVAVHLRAPNGTDWLPARYELGTTVDYPLAPQDAAPQAQAAEATPVLTSAPEAQATAEQAAPAPAPAPQASAAPTEAPAAADAPADVSGAVVGVGTVATHVWWVKDGERQPPDPRPGHYYVVARDGDRHYFLYGPVPTHAEAIALIDDVRAYACEHDPRGSFMAWETARIDPSEEPGPGKITAAMLKEARTRWAAGPLGVAKAPPKCALCKRERGDHQAKTLCCPLGQRHRTLGFTTFDPDQSYTEKAPSKPATPRKARGKGKGAGLTPDAPQEAPEATAGQLPEAVSTAAPHRTLKPLDALCGPEPPFATQVNRRIAAQPELPIDPTKREAWERGELTLAEAQQGPVEGEAALVVGSYCGTGDRE